MTLLRIVPVLAATLAACAMTAQAQDALDLQMPAPVEAVERQTEENARYGLPTGPFGADGLPVRQVSGAVDRRAYRLDAAGVSLPELLAPLRAQLLAAGYEVVFECETRACGGFDFRFATEVIPEPSMHVDLGEFHFLSALRGEQAVSLLLSRSAGSAFVQVIQVGAIPPEQPEVPDMPDPPAGPEAAVSPAPALAPVDAPPRETGPAPETVTARLEQGLPVVLDDLVFAVGAATLEPGDYPSLHALAAWLTADPARGVMLVGHTDSLGNLEANIVLSKRRAATVREVLITRLGVAAGQVTAEGAGPLAPRDTNLTEEGRQRNRRVEAVPAAA